MRIVETSSEPIKLILVHQSSIANVAHFWELTIDSKVSNYSASIVSNLPTNQWELRVYAYVLSVLVYFHRSRLIMHAFALLHIFWIKVYSFIGLDEVIIGSVEFFLALWHHAGGASDCLVNFSCLFYSNVAIFVGFFFSSLVLLLCLKCIE